MVHTRSASPATTVEQNPTVQEEVAQLESRIEARFQAFTREVDLLREEIVQSLEGRDKNLKEWTRSKIAHVTSRMKDLRNFAAEVATFVRETCSSQKSGAAASEPSYTQGHHGVSVSNRVTQSASSGGASGSLTGPPATYRLQNRRP